MEPDENQRLRIPGIVIAPAARLVGSVTAAGLIVGGLTYAVGLAFA